MKRTFSALYILFLLTSIFLACENTTVSAITVVKLAIKGNNKLSFHRDSMEDKILNLEINTRGKE
jgi:hypothetical protein